MEELIVRAAVVAVIVIGAAVVGRWWQTRDARLRPATDAADERLTTDELAAVGLDVDAEVRGLLLSSPACRPCRDAQGVLAEVAADRPDFVWRTVDAGDHLDLTRRHNVLRVPTLLVVDGRGRMLARTSGVPRTTELGALVDDVESETDRRVLETV